MQVRENKFHFYVLQHKGGGRTNTKQRQYIEIYTTFFAEKERQV
jgi:hypothetical protein